MSAMLVQADTLKKNLGYTYKTWNLMKLWISRCHHNLQKHLYCYWRFSSQVNQIFDYCKLISVRRQYLFFYFCYLFSDVRPPSSVIWPLTLCHLSLWRVVFRLDVSLRFIGSRVRSIKLHCGKQRSGVQGLKVKGFIGSRVQSFHVPCSRLQVAVSAFQEASWQDTFRKKFLTN